MGQSQQDQAQEMSWERVRPADGIADTRLLHIGSSLLQVDFAPGALDLPAEAVLNHLQAAALAVTAYFGRFPVARACVLVIPAAGGRGVMQGTTWGSVHGFQGFTRIHLGEHTTVADLDGDWVATHELVHMAFPSLPDEQHWMEEGLATYIEPLARVQTGELESRQVWQDMVRDMPQGEPGAGDQGLNHTHTWGRTYWGGAMFCLVSDVEIRRATGNRKGLQDALRAIVAQGGSIDHAWSLDHALEIGDAATGTHVLTAQYAAWKDSPAPVNLPRLWSELGIHAIAGGIEFSSAAPLAHVREAIAASRVSPARPH